MTTSVSSPEDCINNALTRIGYKRRIGSIWEGTEAARRSLDIYSQTRDELLRTMDWGFARRDLEMTKLKQAPANYVPPTAWNPLTNPPPPWLYEYAYPSDCLRVRAVKPVPIFVPDFDPQPYVFAIDNDDSGEIPQKVILCNVAPPAVLTYSGQVTDPQDWEADFVEILCAALGRRLAALLASLDVVKLEAQDEMQATAAADSVQG